MNYKDAFENSEQVCLNKINNELSKLNSYEGSPKIIIENWYKLSEKNKSKFFKPSLSIYRNWLFHEVTDNGTASSWCADLMREGITDVNFEKIFINPLLDDIEQIFGFTFNNYLVKSYFLFTFFKEFVGNRIIPDVTNKKFKKFIEDSGENYEAVLDAISKKHTYIPNSDFDWKIIGSLTPLFHDICDHQRIWIVNSCLYNQKKIDEKAKIVIDLDIINDFFFYKKLEKMIEGRKNKVETLLIGPLYVKILNNLISHGISKVGQYSFLAEQLTETPLGKAPMQGLSKLTFISL